MPLVDEHPNMIYDVRSQDAPDYLTDGRLTKVPFREMKRFVAEHGAPKGDLFSASTKFALVAVAEKHRIALEPLLDAVAPYEPSQPTPNTAYKEPPHVHEVASDTMKAILNKEKKMAELAAIEAAAPAAEEPAEEEAADGA